MSKSLFTTDIETFFGDVIKEYGLELSETDVDEQNFGNALIEYASSNFGIRFIRDRGQIFMEFCNKREDCEWIDLLSILSQIPEARRNRSTYNYFENEQEPQRSSHQIQHLAKMVKPFWKNIVQNIK